MRRQHLPLQRRNLRRGNNSSNQAEGDLAARIHAHNEQVEILAERRRQLEAEKAELDKFRKQFEQLKQDRDRLAAEVTRWHGLVFPRFLTESDWIAWSSGLREQAEANAEVAMLLAQIHVFAAAFSNSQGRERIYEPLYQIGRAIYVMNKGGSSLADSKQIEVLASALNDHSDGLFNIKVARIGLATNVSWMNFRPNTTQVSEVSSWAVFGENGTSVRNRADVG